MSAPTSRLARAWVPGDSCRTVDSDVDDGRLATLEGYLSKFGVTYEVNSVREGRFIEQVAPGAFAKTIAERGDQVVPLYQHGHDPQLGQKVLGQVEELREDEHGVYYRVALDDTSYNRDLLPALKRGQYGASFMFDALADTWDDKPKRSSWNPEGLPVRTLTEVRLYEFGPVTFPASSAATAKARSLCDDLAPAPTRTAETDPDQVAPVAADPDETEPPVALGLSHPERSALLRSFQLQSRKDTT